jgi:regulatory protein
LNCPWENLHVPELPTLKGRALRLLSTREHSRVELERKLSAHAESPEQLAKVLDELQAKGFISEQRVIDSVLHRRSPKLGASRIRQELQAKGLDPQAVQAAVASLQGDEAERALAVWRRKFGQLPAGASESARQMRFLATRGFSTDIIRRIVSGRLSQPGQD